MNRQHLSLVLPTQLFKDHPALKKEQSVLMVEDSTLFGDHHIGQVFHIKRILLLRAAMQAYRENLEQQGFDVIYIEHHPKLTIEKVFEDPRFTTTTQVDLCESNDFIFDKRIQRVASRSKIHFSVLPSPNFLTPMPLLERHFTQQKKPLMGNFYKEQRQRLGIMVDDDGQPQGGEWSYDKENRRSMPKKGLDVPPLPQLQKNPHLHKAMDHVTSNYAHYLGEIEDFIFPTTHEEAEQWLCSFFEHRFECFGPYEDAISKHEAHLFHSLLTPMLNIGLLQPQDIVDQALQFAKHHNTPLHSLEGFIRQIIGWREYMRGAYHVLGVSMRNANFWGFEDRPIPQSFYTGTTGIEPVDVCIRRALKTGYAHHIERLMILGNFMQLCEFHPRRVYDWFMEMFVDAYDWVMVPNVFGMSQFADGGQFTTKPYISGSNYILKMSDYKKSDWCPIWDGLFWRFIHERQPFFRGQYRLAMMTRQLDKMDDHKKQLHLTTAQGFLNNLWT